MVVAAFLGSISQCTGVALHGTNYRTSDDHLEIRYRPEWYSAVYESEEDLEKNPQKYRDLHDATPFGFFVVRRAKRVTLFEDVQGVRDADPDYVIQAELSGLSPLVRVGTE